MSGPETTRKRSVCAWSWSKVRLSFFAQLRAMLPRFSLFSTKARSAFCKARLVRQRAAGGACHNEHIDTRPSRAVFECRPTKNTHGPRALRPFAPFYRPATNPDIGLVYTFAPVSQIILLLQF